MIKEKFSAVAKEINDTKENKSGIINISLDEDDIVDLSNPCGVAHGQKICIECVNILAQSAQLKGKSVVPTTNPLYLLR